VAPFGFAEPFSVAEVVLTPDAAFVTVVGIAGVYVTVAAIRLKRAPFVPALSTCPIWRVLVADFTKDRLVKAVDARATGVVPVSVYAPATALSVPL
jgi:hypothetical protein